MHRALHLPLKIKCRLDPKYLNLSKFYSKLKNLGMHHLCSYPIYLRIPGTLHTSLKPGTRYCMKYFLNLLGANFSSADSSELCQKKTDPLIGIHTELLVCFSWQSLLELVHSRTHSDTCKNTHSHFMSIFLPFNFICTVNKFILIRISV